MRYLIVFITFFLSVTLFGQNDYSMSFDGLSNAISFQNNPEMIMSTNSFSILTWAKTNDVNISQSQKIVSNGTCACGPIQDKGYHLDFRNYGTPIINANIGGTGSVDNNLSSNFTTTSNTWYHISLTVNRQTNFMYLYIDGIIQDSLSIVGLGDMNNLATIEFGRLRWYDTGNVGEYLDGSVNDVSYWNSALTQEQIQNYMSCPPIGNEEGLIGYWNFEEGSGTTAYDLTGNGNDGAINGATYITDVPEQNCIDQDCSDIEPNFNFIGSIDDCCYYTYNDTTSWTEANAICENYEGSLVTINNSNESDLLNNLLGNPNTSNGNQYWINLIDGESEWNNGDTLDFTNYDTSYVSEEDDYMFLQNNGYWDNSPNDGSGSNTGIYPLMEICQSNDSEPSNSSGCTDSLANNYNPEATLDDGTCCYLTIAQNDTTICLGDSISLGVSSATTQQNAACLVSELPAGLNNGLSHFYPFCGNADDIVNGINGTLHGATLTTDRFGNIDNAFVFDGNDYIELNNTFYGGAAMTQLSYNVWFRVDQLSSEYTISGKEGYWKTIRFSLGTNGTVSFGGSSSSTYFGISSPSNAYSFGVWHMATVTLSGGQFELFIDAVSVATETSNASQLEYQFHAAGNSTATNYIGAIHPVSPGITNYFVGSIDDLGLWDRALNSQEVQELYNGSSDSTSNIIWSTGDTTETITVSPTQTTTYWVEQTENGVSCTDSVTVTVLPTTSVITDITACNSYDWNGNTYTESGTYSYSGAGSNNYSMNFGTVNDYMEFTNKPIASTWNEGTISTWVKFNDDNWGTGGDWIFNGHTGTGDDMGLGIHTSAYFTNQYLRFGFDINQNWEFATSNIVPNIDQWYYLVGTWGANGIQLYIDGVLSATNSYSGPSPYADELVADKTPSI